MSISCVFLRKGNLIPIWPWMGQRSTYLDVGSRFIFFSFLNTNYVFFLRRVLNTNYVSWTPGVSFRSKLGQVCLVSGRSGPSLPQHTLAVGTDGPKCCNSTPGTKAPKTSKWAEKPIFPIRRVTPHLTSEE